MTERKGPWLNWYILLLSHPNGRANGRLFFLSLFQIDENSTLPVSISEIRIEGARHTKKGFLEKVVAPALSSRREGSYTLASALEELHNRTNVLHQFGISICPQWGLHDIEKGRDKNIY